MAHRCCGAVAVSMLVLPIVVTATPAQAAPLPDFCTSAVGDVCTTRLTSVTADAVDGTITGTPIGGAAPVTLAGQGDAYLKSTGFGVAAPEPVQDWDATIDRVGGLSVDPTDPSWYGNAKARVFLPRTLNELATRFPPDSLVVRFAPDDGQPGVFRLVSIQPTAR
ncbi:hypothetical protein SBI67_27770 [Mycolicibacterium sp. 120266]|uniref:hypothetical protein n=1 Tax=Mycolicibacterium sp. 120266 TaxID=3090601 RepID=UPI00299ECAC4|nr:hypothetical protein [Mycolicibacterium sp. 120266]MDX1875933.1 hypothetical protein [Mycolicibacterium sp. 120266]